MDKIETYVFFDIETTGLPWQERNQTKITELSFVAVLKKDLLKTKQGESPAISKLTLVFNPGRKIHPDVVVMNGLSNELLQNAPLFSNKIETMLSFLQELPQPVCLVAHNGNRFDYKIFLAECQDANFSPPNDLLCIDSLVGFRTNFSNNKAVNGTKKIKSVISPNIPSTPDISNLLTDDEDEWPDLNLSTEEWVDIDKLCDSLSDISCEETEQRNISVNEKTSKKKSASRSKVIVDVFKKRTNSSRTKDSFTLLALYKRLLNKEASNHHRAEDDCLMLLQCVTCVKEQFVPWAEQACSKLIEIKPLTRY